ncbi:MAG: hypothetical protein EHM70_17225, partial [Chloroflexota bacterium]
MNNSTSIVAIVIGLFVTILCCLCLCLVVAGVFYIVSFPSGTIGPIPVTLDVGNPTQTPVVIRPTPQKTPTPFVREPDPQDTPANEETPTAVEPTLEDVATVSLTDTLAILENEIVPINDVRELALRLEGKEDIPVSLDPPAVPYSVGDQETFWVSNTDTNDNFQVTAVLRYVTPHLYFWVDEDVRYDQRELSSLAEAFERDIYPTNREFFGSEWTPGVDGDEHLYILLANGLGFSVAGYFSSADEYTPQAHEYSNAHEMFMLSAENTDLGDDFTYGVLAHEFQHMIHWYRDRNETSWLNEGFSEVAAFINGFDVGGFDSLFISDPDLQLNDWPNDQSATRPHYGAGFMFLTYFLDRFGDDATKALVADAENGMVSVSQALEDINAVDPQTGELMNADDFFADWVITNYLKDGTVGDGRFTYNNYAAAPQAGETERIRTCPFSEQTRDVSQYGTDYILITCRGEYTLHFEGSTQVGVVPADAYSGSYAYWSNKGDESDMTLTREFDFSDQTGSLTLSYWTWYDLEEDYDYVYVEASLDGDNWQILTTPSGTAEDPSGNSYGWGYNGLSGRTGKWIQEEV